MLYIAAYCEERVLDFFLPEAETLVTTLYLSRAKTNLDKDLVIPVRALQRHWFMGLPKGFYWVDNVTAERPVSLGKYVMTDGRTHISLVITLCKDEQQIFTKYLFFANKKFFVGRSEKCAIQYDSPLASAEQGYFERHENRAIYVDGSSNGTFINGERLRRGSVELDFGDVLVVPPDLKIVYLGEILAVNKPSLLKKMLLEPMPLNTVLYEDPDKEPGPDPVIQYNRVPRLLRQPDVQEMEIEPPLGKQEENEQPLWLTLGPSMTMVLPMLMGSLAMSQNGSGFMAGGLVMVGTSAALGTMWGLINSKYRKKIALNREDRRINLYRKYLQEVEADLKMRSAAELNRLKYVRMSTEECAQLPALRSNRLWERMPSHDDFLDIRMGVGDAQLPGKINIQAQKLSFIEDELRNEPKRLKEQYSRISNAPMHIGLRKLQMVGVLGLQKAKDLAQSMLMQIAALHSYNDVKICVITDEKDYESWKWTRWLPHVYPTVDRDFRMCVCQPGGITDVLNYLYEVLGTRVEIQNEQNDRVDNPEDFQPLPHYVIFCTDPALLEGQQIMNHLLKGYYGMTLVQVAPSMEWLPKECKLVVDTQSDDPGIFSSDGEAEHLYFEPINPEWVEGFAKSIAPIRVNDIEESSAIPSYVTFLESYHVTSVDELDVWRFWNENMTYDGLKSVIGLKSGGEPFVLDISERLHGPHGLVAGTTGSGKSVMLQTYILSLALNYSPRQVQFAIIDYKGGGMANAFAELPHVAGSINDIQGEQDVARALASVQGEIDRRKRMLAEMGAENVDEYNRMLKNHSSIDAIPHLIIVVDEFAELRREKPEFMKELITAARVGRSLGIHLILATQKPSNSVDDEIWSNTRFRLCLRVASRGDSNDMLKRPDAAYLKGMGRCYVQVGSDELFEQVQTCYSGAAYTPNSISPEQRPRLLNHVGKPITIKEKKNKKEEITQMDAVMEHILKVAKKYGVEPARRMWKNRLEAVLFLQKMASFRENRFNGEVWPVNETGEIRIEVGSADDVNRQLYTPFYVDITENRNYLLVGMPQSGKTVALQTIAMALCEKYSPEDVQIYAYSLSSKTLGTLKNLPHVGGVVYEDEKEEQVRLLSMLETENNLRKAYMSQASTDSFLEYRKAAQLNPELPVVPTIVVLVDRLFQARELLGDDYFDKLSLIIREGSSRGIFFIATALAITEIPWKLQASFYNVALENPARGDYTDVLGMRMPAEMVDILHTPGRGVAKVGDELMEIQFGIYNEGEERLADVERAALIQKRAEEMDKVWTGIRPKQVPRIPQEPVMDDLLAVCTEMDSFAMPMGFRVVEGTPFTADLWNDFSWLAIGPGQSGKTTWLKNVARIMGNRGAEMLVITENPDEWQNFTTEGTLTVAAPESEACMDFLLHMKEESGVRLQRRNQAQDEAGQKERILEFPPLVVLMDNLDQYQDRMQKSGEFLGTTCARAVHFGVYCFATATPSGAYGGQLKPIVKGFVQRNSVLALRGKLADCDLFPSQLNYAQKNQQLPLGYAYLVHKGEARQLIVPNL